MNVDSMTSEYGQLLIRSSIHVVAHYAGNYLGSETLTILFQSIMHGN